MADYAYPEQSVIATNPSIGPNGQPAPIQSTEIGFIDGSGNLQGVSSTNPLPVTIESEVGTLDVNISEYGGVATTLGQKVSASSLPVVIASDQSAVPISASSLPLPTGAATSANQTTEITALGTINTTLGSPFQAGGSIGNTSFIATQTTGSNLHVEVDNFPATQPISGTVAISNFPATQPISGTVTADQGTSPWVISGTVTADAGTGDFTVVQPTGTNLHAVIDSGTVAVTQSTSPWVISGAVTSGANTNGQVNNSVSVGTSPTTFTPPANAVGFVVEAESSNTVNLRYACGTTASTTVGMLLEPGRDSGFVPSSATVTVCAVSSSGQAASIQWIMSS